MPSWIRNGHFLETEKFKCDSKRQKKRCSLVNPEEMKEYESSDTVTLAFAV